MRSPWVVSLTCSYGVTASTKDDTFRACGRDVHDEDESRENAPIIASEADTQYASMLTMMIA